MRQPSCQLELCKASLICATHTLCSIYSPQGRGVWTVLVCHAHEAHGVMLRLLRCRTGCQGLPKDMGTLRHPDIRESSVCGSSLDTWRLTALSGSLPKASMQMT